MDKLMFFRDFPKMACSLHYLSQSQNNNKRPNKKNDVITDLGGEGDFPMFLYDACFLASLKSTSDSASYRILIAPGTLSPLSQ